MKTANIPCVELNVESRVFSNKGMVEYSHQTTLSVMLLLYLGLGASAAFAASGDPSTDLSAAQQALNAALAAEARATAEYQRLRKNGSLSPAELGEYRTFLTRLDRMVRANCQAVSRLKTITGDTSPEPTCEHRSVTDMSPLSFPNEQTEEERMAVLERRLGSSLSEFDEMLLREMEQLARTQTVSPDAGSGSGSRTGGQPGTASAADDQSAPSDKAGGKTSSAADSGGKSTSDRSSDKTATGAARETDQTAKVDDADANKGAERSGTVVRDDVPEAGDDDVVARQLREAAENETDPELREKLWREYKRYKSDKAQGR